MEAITDLHTQVSYLRSLCQYVENYLHDLQGVQAPSEGLTPHQHGIIYAATNRLGGQVRQDLEEAQRHAEAWAIEVRNSLNGYA
jgi:hypothetical protein